MGRHSAEMRSRLGALAGFLLLFACFSGAAFAQSDTGTITGTVTDPKGLAMSGVTVLIHNADTGADQKPIVTTDSGIYVLTLLPPGNYDITARQTGFSTVQHKGVMLQVGQTIRIDIAMPVATQQSLVTVTTEVPVLETEKTENSQNINEDLVSNLPVSSRRWEQLALLTPGVSYDGTLGAVSFRGLGGEYNQNSVDGANNEDSYDETTRGGYNESYVYSADSIREFQVASSGFNAELGQAAGGAVNAVTKSGTSSFHGDLFYSGRSPDFNAFDPVGKAQAASTGTVPTQPVHQQNQWGGSFAGPIIKDRLFFFVTDDGFRKVEPLTVTTPQLNPSIDNLACPNVAVVTAAQCLAAKQFVDAHAIGVFPRDMRQDVGLVKLDFQINQSNHFSVVTNIRDYHLPESSQLYDPEATGGLATLLQDRFVIANLTTVIGNDKVNEFRYQWGSDNSINPENLAVPAPEVALTNLFTYGTDDSSAYTLELRNQFSDNFSITKGTHTIKFGGDANLVNDNVQGSITADGPYTYSGSVALPPQAGGCTAPVAAAQTANTTFCEWLVDLYRYNTGSAATTGNHFASFGQTLDTVGTTPNNFVYKMPFQDIAGYIQDTWKAKPNLTVNYGLRYDAQIFPHLPYSVAEVFPSGDLPIFDYYTSKYPNTTNGLQPRLGIAWNFRKNTVLRIGGGEFVAETAGHNLKNVYSGAGEASVSCNPGACTGAGYPTPAGQPYAGLEFPDLFVSQNRDSPLGTAPVLGATPAQTLYTDAASAVTIPNPKFSIRGADPNLTAARAYEAEVGLEQQLPGNMNLSVQYVFTRGNHLPRGQDGNIGGSFDPSLCSSAASVSGVNQSSCGTSITKPYYVTDANGNVVLTPSVTGLLQLPLYSSAPAGGGFPGFTSRVNALTGGIPSNASTINTIYNGMNVTLRKPMSHGLEVLANYTWAHALDNGDVGGTQLATVALNPQNTQLEYGNSTTDVRNRFTASVVYAPAAFKNSSNALARWALSGWALSTTVTATNGVHYTGQANGTSSQTVEYCGLPVAGCAFSGYALPGSTTLLASPITFTGLGGGMTGAGIGSTGTPAGSRISWLPNGFFVLPNFYDVDLRLIRQVTVKERYHFELRLEAFNLFNSTIEQADNTTAYNYTKPGTAVGTGTCPAGGITCMTPSATFMTPTITSGNLLGARQLQAGLRFEF